MDFTVSAESTRLIATARNFALNELEPVAREYERRTDPSETLPMHLIARASELGLRTMGLPKEFGGAGTDALTESMVLEAICEGDVGFGNALAHAWREGRALATIVTPQQRERYLPAFMEDPFFLPAFALTEAYSGSDNAVGYAATPEAGPQTTATRDGDQWVLNGTKCWISNASFTPLLFVVARTDSTVDWREGISIFLVDGNTPGITTSVEDKLGVRTNQNTEVRFDDVRVPAVNLVGEVDRGASVLAQFLAGSAAKEGAKALGVAKAALREAVAFARTRVASGRPLAEHGAVRGLFGELAAEIEGARTLVWRACWAADHEPQTAATLGSMAKVCGTEVAAKVALRTFELFGGAGTRRDFPIEKLLRDAMSMLHVGAGNHALRDQLGGQLGSPNAGADLSLGAI